MGHQSPLMRYEPLSPGIFSGNRSRLCTLLPPKSVAVVNANDILPTNADGSLAMRPNTDLFYLTGVEQEETVLLVFPDADDEKLREILFLREPNDQNQMWEGHKLSKDEASALTGIKTVKWTHEFWPLFRRLACEAERVFINSNEHKRAAADVETRDERFIEEARRRFPLHDFRRLAPLLHQLRIVKSEAEVGVIRRACKITEKAFRRVLRFTRPGVTETDVEAEFAHEFTRGRGRFAYEPIIAAGRNACVLHYIENSATLKKGQLLLLDVGASYSNYNSDMTRTIPVSGRFSRRQKQVYNAVLRVLKKMTGSLRPGTVPKTWQKESEALMTEELLGLGLLKSRDVKKQDPDWPAVKKYFMHGLGHPIGLDVHDVGDTTQPMRAGWVMTVEPGIYVPEEDFAVRLENTVLVTEKDPENLMAGIPIEPEEIEDLMGR